MNNSNDKSKERATKRRNKKRKNTIIATAIVIIFALLIGGLSFKSLVDKKRGDLILTIDKNKLYMEDMMYYIYMIEENYNQYEQIYTQFMGKSYWDEVDDNGKSMRELAKEEAIDLVSWYEILYDQATRAGYEPTADEMTKIKNDVKNFLESLSKEQLDKTGFTEKVLIRTIQKASVVSKYYADKLAEYDVDEESIKKGYEYNDYRQYDFEYLCVETSESDENGSPVAFDEKEKKKAYDLLESVFEQAKNGEEFTELALVDSDNISEGTLSFVKGDESVEPELEEAAVKLENGQVHDAIIETEFGYYIIKMVNNNSSESYDSAIEEAISLAREDEFTKDYNKMLEGYKIVVNEKDWNKVVIGNLTSATTTPLPDSPQETGTVEE